MNLVLLLHSCSLVSFVEQISVWIVQTLPDWVQIYGSQAQQYKQVWKRCITFLDISVPIVAHWIGPIGGQYGAM